MANTMPKPRSYDEVVTDVMRSCTPADLGTLAVGSCALDHFDSPEQRSDEQMRLTMVCLEQYWLDSPLQDAEILYLVFDVAQQIGANFAQYDLIVADEICGLPIALLFHRLTNLFRHDAGLGSARFAAMNSKYDGPPIRGMFPKASSKAARALIVTDYVHDGSGLKTMHRTLTASRDPASIDAVTLALVRQRSRTPANVYAPKHQNVSAVNARVYGRAIRQLLGRDKDDFTGPLHSRPFTLDKAGENRKKHYYQDAQRVADSIYWLLQEREELSQPESK